jgi:hypothetical protein
MSYAYFSVVCYLLSLLCLPAWDWITRIWFGYPAITLVFSASTFLQLPSELAYQN